MLLKKFRNFGIHVTLLIFKRIQLSGPLYKFFFNSDRKMNKNYFILELLKSGPFLLLLIIAVVIVLGILISNHHKETVKMKENIMYVAPNPTK